MKILVKKDYQEMSLEVAEMVRNEINTNPNLVWGLATGSNPTGTYK